MAFNPFHKFRKHQKTLIAALAIFCMFMFVVSLGAGGGDMMSWLSRSLSFNSRTTPAAKLYGKDVDERELAELATQRRLAREYLSRVLQAAMMSRLDEMGKSESVRMQQEQMRQQFKSFMPPAQIERVLQEGLQRQAMNSDPDFQQLMRLASQYHPQFARSGTQDLLDFMIWRHEADKLGISLTKDDIGKLLQWMTNKRIKNADASKAESEVMKQAEFRRLPGNPIIRALNDEFRVQMAQMALRGEDWRGESVTESALPGKSLAEVPAVPTPEEFWNFYRKECGVMNIALIPVPVRDFLSQVKDKSTEKDLKAVYEKYKEQTAAADGRTPGFKEPRKIEVEWVGVKIRTPENQKAAERSNELATALAAFGTASGGGLPAAVDLALPTYSERGLVARYTMDRSNGDYRAQEWTRPWGFYNQPKDRYHLTSLYKPANVAGLVGQALGLGGDLAPPLVAVSGLGAFAAPATAYELEQKAKFGSTIVFNRLISPLAAAATVEAVGQTDQYEPYSLIRPVLARDAANETIQKLVKVQLQAVQQEVEMHRLPAQQVAEVTGLLATVTPGVPLKGPVLLLTVGATAKVVESERKAAIAKAIAQLGLEHGKTGAPRDQNRDKIADDPGLKPLKEAHEKTLAAMPFMRDQHPFDGLFFGTNQSPAPAAYSGQMLPFFPSDRDERQFLWWKTTDKAPETVPWEQPRNLPAGSAATVGAALTGDPYAAMAAYKFGAVEPEIRREVEEAWRYEKARELAKKAADELAKKAGAAKGDEKQLVDIAGKKGLIKLDPLARQKRERSSNPEAKHKYVGPKLDKSKVPNIDDKDEGGRMSEASRMGQELLQLREKPRGETLVVADDPASAYYVAVLLGELDPPMKDFLEAYQDTATESKNNDPLFTEFLRLRQRDYRRDLMARLRTEANLELLKTDDRNRLGGDPDE